MKQYVTEMIGTFFLVLTIALTVTQGVELAPVAIGLVLMVMVYMGGYLSGAHYNPAVTVALLIRGKISISDSIGYRVSQIVGALIAVAVAAYITGSGFVPAPGAEYAIGQAVLVEILFTFALASVVLHTAATDATSGNDYYGLAIGCTVLVAAFAGGAISGGAFNPAVGLGPRLYDTFTGGGFSHVWILYVVSPVVGAIFAALFHQFVTDNSN